MQPSHPYGSALRRFSAFLADAALLAALSALMDLVIGTPAGSAAAVQQSSPSSLSEAFRIGLQEGYAAQQGLRGYLEILLHMLYWPLFEISNWQATPGKRLLSLYVADTTGNRLSFLRALIRNVSKFLSVITLGFGFLMIAVTVKNQCLHDKIAGSVVLKGKASQPDSH